MCAQLQSLGGWRLCGRNMHGPDVLIDARLAGTRAPAWVAAVGDEGIDVSPKVEAARPENFHEK